MKPRIVFFACIGPVVAALLIAQVTPANDENQARERQARPAQRQAGPQQAAPQRAAPQQAAPQHAAPRQATPRQAEPRQAERRQAEPRQAERRQAEPRQAEPRRAEPRQAEPRRAEPRQAEPRLAEPRQAAPVSPRVMPSEPSRSGAIVQPPARRTPAPPSRPEPSARERTRPAPTAPSVAQPRAPERPTITERHAAPPGAARQRDGSYAVRTERGEARFRPDGSLRSVHSRDLTVMHGPSGGHRVIRQRPDRTVIVARGHGRGYIQRPFVSRNREFVQRTFYGDRRIVHRFYQPYRFRGFLFFVYAPVIYYPPIFYDWVFAPWPAGIYFHWGWYGAPWYAYYGPYFSPYAVYPAPPFWLTDYLLAWELERDYRDRLAADEAALAERYAQAPISDEVKRAIADEVRRQIEQERLDSETVARGGIPDPALSGLARLLADKQSHVFVVSSALDVMSATEPCTLTPGDVLQLDQAPPAEASFAYLKVLASKSGSCARGSIVVVSLEDLQEMQNHMREVIDQGLVELRSGQGGIPAAPPAALRGEFQPPYATAAPGPDPGDVELLNQTEKEGGLVEQEFLNQLNRPETDGHSQAPARITPIGAGEEMYASYCAKCHGRDGKGTGSISPTLKRRVTDLSTLAKRNGGVFPAERVKSMLRGDLMVAPHGSRDMPVWGPAFRYMGSGSRAEVDVRIDNLTRYLEALQAPAQ